jgi:hypothetical protein
VVTWAVFEADAPEIAAETVRLLRRGEIDEALLATVRGDGLPRIHPIYVAIVDGHLYGFMLPSGKSTDLELDGRFALHTHQDPSAPSEAMLRGRATLIGAGPLREAVAAAWSFEVGEADRLFEFSIEGALLGERATADDWPPIYRSWAAPD